MKIPPGACDCHVHVFGPAARYPFAADRTYTPPDASVEELLQLQRRLGFERVVIVHPSPYGTDNSCTLDALRNLRERARGIAVIDKEISKEELLEMQELGVRGVRLNLQTEGVHDASTACSRLQEAAARVAPLGWHVQTFTNLAVKTGNVYVKLSGPHRVPIDPGPLARALIAANPERCLWGTDWPHPFTRGARQPAEVQPFDPIDDVAALERFHGWVGDAALFRKILVDNPARLYDF